MKIFISHSSANSNIGNAFVNLLTGIGVKHDEVVFTSNVAYGIPTGEKIFDWLRKQMTDKPFVVYLLSNEYYKSVACLNEMGAAWIIENDHVILFVPGFDINSHEFHSGALDPREIGFIIDDEGRLLQLVESLKANFRITSNVAVISQRVKDFLSIVHKEPIISDVVTKNLNIEPLKYHEIGNHMVHIPDDERVLKVPTSKLMKGEKALYDKLCTVSIRRSAYC